MFADNVGLLFGGWVASIVDTNQWLQIDMTESYIFKVIQMQGRSDEAAWVTSFRILYGDNITTFHTYANASNATVSICMCYMLDAEYLIYTVSMDKGHLRTRNSCKLLIHYVSVQSDIHLLTQ